MSVHNADTQIVDGGGTRGYSTLLILQELMKAIIRLEESYPDGASGADGPAQSSYHPLAPPTANLWCPCHYFDYIAGTGTGGLIAIMLGRLRMDVDDSIVASKAVLTRILSKKRHIHMRSFPWWPREKYDHMILEQEIQKVVRQFAPKVPGYTRDSEFAFNENQCRTVVIADRKIKGGRNPYLFRTYKSFNGSVDPESRILDPELGLAHHGPIWQVARATSATPTFFKPMIIDGFVDIVSGIGTINPCVEIYEEVKRMNGNKASSITLSLGSGKGGSLSWDRKTRYPKLSHHINAARKLDSQSELTHETMLSKPGYFRLNVEEGLGQMKLDEWRTGGYIYGLVDRLVRGKPTEGRSSFPTIAISKSHIRTWFQQKDLTELSIRRHTQEYLEREDVRSMVHEIARILVERRRNRVRSDLDRWEKFCSETWYICRVSGCPSSGKEYGSHGTLQRHLLHKHRDIFSERDMGLLNDALDQGQIRVG